MSELKFKVGDWVYCEFNLALVVDTKDNRITGVHDGLCTLGSYDLSERCFPLDIEIKRISDTVSFWSKQISKLNLNGLNHPDINEELIRRWVEICNNRSNEEKRTQLIEELAKFANEFIKKVKELKRMEVQGIECLDNQLLYRMKTNLETAKLFKTNIVFSAALASAEVLSTDDLLDKFKKLNYKSFGFPALMLYMNPEDGVWSATLRNNQDWKENMPECKGDTLKRALELMYAYCVYMRYLSNTSTDHDNEGKDS